MSRFLPSASSLRRGLSRTAFLLAASWLAAASVTPADAYSLNGKTWPSGDIVFRFGLGNPVLPLSDGHRSWNDAVAPVLDMWNAEVGRIRLKGVMNATSAASSGDRVNSVVFSNTVFGQSFGKGTLAVTYYIMQGSSLLEADVLFNTAITFDSYRGDLRFGGAGGMALADIRRVFLHELGHGLGLNHSSGDNVMDPTISDREVLSGDDIAGARAMYGAPAAPPPPPPPPPPPAGASRLANISTRARVGTNSDVLIGGFIVTGAESKRIILRAIGPSIAQYMSGTLGDPVLELIDGAGRLIAENNNWQSSAQAGEISASGVAPSHWLEAAVIATVPAGSYTAIVRGWNNSEGIALIEGYELDNNSTRLMNISTRARIGTDAEVLIGGFIVKGNANKRLVVRAVGPSIAQFLPGALGDPNLELVNAAGQLVASNDNWVSSPQANEIIGTGVQPSQALESAVVADLPPGNYTAIVRGVNNGVGVGLVEVYDLQP